VDEPLSAVRARQLARKSLEEGSTRFSRHARDRMDEHGMSELDVTNTIRGGHVREERGMTFENGSWRYTIETMRMAVVVAFASEKALVIVTVWRVES